MLRELARNLLHNAIKHTPQGAPLAVRLVADSRTVALTVGDSGPGIASELAARLFQPFSAGDVRTDRAWAWPSAGKSPKRSAAASAWRTGSSAGARPAWMPRCDCQGPTTRGTIRLDGKTAHRQVAVGRPLLQDP
jgi:hypothetical protein